MSGTFRSFFSLLFDAACFAGQAHADIITAGKDPGTTERRVALVIGISAYQSITTLTNPINDAKLMAATLRDLGFTLVGGDALTDLDKPTFDRVIKEFGASLKGASAGLFYYAGHGIQVSGTNWLIPTTANPTVEADVPAQMVDIAQVMRAMEQAGTKLNIVILDACRNNPFPDRELVVADGLGQLDSAKSAAVDPSVDMRSYRALSGGLGKIEAPEGTLISYATQPGNVALDGTGGNSPYSAALARTIRQPGLDIFRAFNIVGLEVKRMTSGLQQPWVSSSPLDGDFYFAGPPTSGDSPEALALAVRAKAESDAARASAEAEAAAVRTQMALASLNTGRGANAATPSDLKQIGTVTQVSQSFGFIVAEKKAAETLAVGQYAFIKTKAGFEVTRIAKINGGMFSLTGVYANNDAFMKNSLVGDGVFVAN